MAERDSNIQMKLLSVDEISFMMSPGQIKDEAKEDSFRVGFSSLVQPDSEKDRLALTFGTKYEADGETVLQCTYRFEFEIKGLSDFIVSKGDTVTIKRVMPHVLNVAVGTMRGILVVKTAGTRLSDFPLPIVDTVQLCKDLSL